MEEKLKLLIKEWEEDENFLRGPDDHECDRAAGEVYGICARRLKEILESSK